MANGLSGRAALMAGFLLSGGAGAQDIAPVFDMGGLAATASLGAVINSERDRAAHPNVPAPRAATASVGGAFLRPAPSATAAAPMRYNASLALSREAVAAIVDRVRRHNPDHARLIQEQLEQHDYRAIYDGIVRPYGLAGDDTASALAAYLLLGWMIVHDGAAPPPGAVRAVRGQAIVALSDGRLNSPETRARLGEEFKILFVTLHAGWQSARREGNLDSYGTGVADIFRTDSIDLAAMDLGLAGFQPRQKGN